jgi:5,10-methylenetetrahydromethanopterin reductase
MPMALELWTTGIAHANIAPRAAARAEAAGWDGMVVVDSQNLSGDPFVALALAARETTSLLLGTGVTNPATRHPAAAAAAIASVHVASRGRARLGIGRGDSALAHLGLAPASVADLEAYVRILRAYLRGGSVPFADLRPYEHADARTVDALGLADTPSESSLQWLRTDLEPVPVEVVATGPRVLEMAAREGDRVLLAVGADPGRVRWAVDRVRAAGGTKIAAFVNVVSHPDVDLARRLGAGGLSLFARFSAMDGKVRTPIDADSEAVLHRVHDAYDMHDHSRAGSPQASRLTADFVDRFGIIGPPEHCIDRLAQLVAMGIDKLIIVGPSADADRDEAHRARDIFESEVLPAVRLLVPEEGPVHVA